ncbi:MAG: hypothetical protein DCC55_11340 [Chloroflexi bacterium]|nr:MAG: hypothetical protein DCC55_11340 [Chloroflexota bacterium]
MWPLNICQIGKEATPGTAVAATTIWRGPFGSWDDDRQTEEIPEDVGTFAFSERTLDTFLGAKIPFPQGVAHYQQMLYLAEGSIGKVSATGSGPYVRDYIAQTGDSAPNLQTYTLRVGNKLVSADLALLAYALPMEWELSGKQQESWKVSGTFMAPRKQSGSFTNGLDLPAWVPMVFGHSKLYIDADGGTFGTTQKTGVLMAFSVKYTPQVEWVPIGDGDIYAKAHKIARPLITFTMQLEVEQDTGVSTVATERDHYDSKAIRLIRIDCTRDANHKMILDLAGQYTKVGAYEKSGQNNTVVTFEGKALYSPTNANFFRMELTTPLQNIP